VDTPWEEIGTNLQSFIELKPKERGERFAAFLRNGGKVIVGEPKVITINRNRFNPKKFVGDGWSILNDETDSRSIALTELDLIKVELRTMLRDGESYVKGEERLKRLKSSDYIRLDADVFHTLFHNQHLIPKSWKEKFNGNTRYIHFEGTVLQRSDGVHFFLCLYWYDGRWDWSVTWLGQNLRGNNQSAVLTS
jgi:hypothetical protein